MYLTNDRKPPRFCECDRPEVCCPNCCRCVLCGRDEYWVTLEVIYALVLVMRVTSAAPTSGATAGSCTWMSG